MSTGLKTADEGWVGMQKKTFTKWMNNHLRKRGYGAVNEIHEDFEDGVKLMQLINSLYGIDFPKYNKAPKMRPHKLDNVNVAFKMVEQAKIKTNFLKDHHLVDHDLKMLLGMVWAIILDYQIKGVSVEDLTAKEGLLLWCQKKTQGYKDVSINNFTTDWQTGLAFCALIHRHRPDLIDYDSLDKANNKHNLELAFDVAEKKLGIPRLLDVEDVADVRPDERSVMTYVSEYFHCFASQNIKEKEAGRVQKFIQFNQGMEQLESEYEAQASGLSQWINEAIQKLNQHEFEHASSADQVKEAFEAHKQYLATEKPAHVGTKLDLEASYVQIQTKLSVYGRNPYKAPSGLSTDELEALWDQLEHAEKARGQALRVKLFSFITKATTTVSDDQIREFEASFKHFDKDNDNTLNPVEFKAALTAMSIPFKDDEELRKVFLHVSGGAEGISLRQYVDWLISLSEDKDTADAIKKSFSLLADNSPKIGRNQLKVYPLNESDIQYLASKMPAEGEVYDYPVYVDSHFKQ